MYGHVFVLMIIKILNGWQFWPFLESPIEVLAGGKMFRIKVRGLKIVTNIRIP